MKIHIRHHGRSYDIEASSIDVGDLSDDEEILSAVAGYVEAGPDQMMDYVVERHRGGNVTVRPNAVFG